MLQRLQNFGWLSTEEVVRLGLGFVVTVLLARYLGAAEFGSFGYIFSLVVLFTPFAMIGLDPIVIKNLVEDRAASGRVIGTATALRVIGALFAFALAMVTMASLPAPPGTSVSLVVVACVSLLALPWQTPNLYFKAIERPRRIAVPRILIAVAAASVAVMLIVRGHSMESFVRLRAAEAVAMAMSAMLSLTIWRQRDWRLALDFKLAKSLVRNGFPLLLSGMAGIVYLRIDQIMLGQLNTVEELGRYTIAVRISDSVFFVPMALQAAFFPAILKAKAMGEREYRAELRRFFDLMSLIMCLIAMGVVCLGTGAILYVIGPAYTGSISMIAILALGLPFVGLGVARSCHLTTNNWFWTAPAAAAIGAVVNIVLNFSLIPKIGGNGAAVASVLSYWVAAHGTCYLFPWLRDIGWDLLASLNLVSAARRLSAFRSASRD